MKAKQSTLTVITVFGILSGLAGMEHGVGEILQGGASPGIVFASWPGSTFFQSVAGEPAMSLIPNLWVSGIVSIILSLAFIGWALLGKRRWWAALLLSVLLLLTGGGFGPPLLGSIIAMTALRLNAPLKISGERHVPLLRKLSAAAWPWLFGLAIAAWLVLMPGVMLFDLLIGVKTPERVVPYLVLLAFTLLLLAIATSHAHDARNAESD